AGEGEILPAVDLVRFDGALSVIINRSAESNADTADLGHGDARACEQFRNHDANLSTNPGAARYDVDRATPRMRYHPVAGAEAQLQFRAADFDADEHFDEVRVRAALHQPDA